MGDSLATAFATTATHDGDPPGLQGTVRHMCSRDFPVSTAGFRRIMNREGFPGRAHR